MAPPRDHDTPTDTGPSMLGLWFKSVVIAVILLMLGAVTWYTHSLTDEVDVHSGATRSWTHLYDGLVAIRVPSRDRPSPLDRPTGLEPRWEICFKTGPFLPKANYRYGRIRPAYQQLAWFIEEYALTADEADQLIAHATPFLAQPFIELDPYLDPEHGFVVTTSDSQQHRLWPLP